MASGGSRVVRFGVFEVDLGARELRKRGVRIRLQDQPFRVLEALLESPGEIVTREQLKGRLWAQDEFVEFDKSLNTAIQKIRQALGDSAESPRFLETVPKVGYRFIAQTQSPAPEPEGSAQISPTESRQAWSGRLWPIATLGLLILAALGWFRAIDTPIERSVRRFTITPGTAGAGIYSRAHQGGYPAAAAISPDGNYVAYLSSEATPRLWIHQLTSGESRPVSEIEYAPGQALIGDVAFGARVFWSPASNSVGFFSRSSLRRYSLADESVTTLHTLENLDVRYCGAAWSPDGKTIVFSAGSEGGTRWFAIPAAGGDARSVAADLSGRMGNPVFVPGDEAAVIFHTSHAFRQDLYLMRLSSGETSLLAERAKSPSWSPTGHVVFDRDGSVWALPFSADALESTGEPFLVEPGYANAGVSEDGTLISVTSETLGKGFRLSVRDRQGQLAREVASPLYGAYNPSVSPDGRQVAVAGSLEQELKADVWIFDVSAERSRRLTTDAESEDSPLWTGDGNRVLYRINSPDADFAIVDQFGSKDAETVLDNELRLAEPSFSPDEQTLIYQTRPLESVQFDIAYLRNPLSAEQEGPISWLESRFDEAHPQFSPDGRYVAYRSEESGSQQIHVRPFPQGSPVWQVSTEGGSAPRWSRDGRELYWWGQSEGFPLMAAEVDFTRSEPVGSPTELFQTARAAHTFFYDVTPDGHFVIVEPMSESDSDDGPPILMRITQNWYEEFRDRK